MSLAHIYESLDDKFFLGKAQHIKNNMVKPLLRGAIYYDRISSFFSPTVIKEIIEEIAVCLSNDGIIRLVIGIHDSTKLTPVLKAKVNYNDKRFKEAIESILTEKISDSINYFDDVSLLQSVLRELINLGRVKIKISAVRDDYEHYINSGSWPEPDNTFHPKLCIFRDSEHTVVVQGSFNETNRGYGNNIEQADCFCSSNHAEKTNYCERTFEDIWTGKHPDCVTLNFDEEIIRISNKISSSKPYRTALKRNANSSPYFDRFPDFHQYYINKVNLLPHQNLVYTAAIDRWPIRALLADEVGLGKTIETGAILRYIDRHVNEISNINILVPASLRYQWQAELYNLFGLTYYIYDPDKDLYYFDYDDKTLISESPKHKIISWHYIRNLDYSTLNSKFRADITIVDEAHQARIHNLEPKESTKLFQTLEFIFSQCEHRILLTATPQQTNELDYLSLIQLVSGIDFNLDSLVIMAEMNRGESLSLTTKFKLISEYQKYPDFSKFSEISSLEEPISFLDMDDDKLIKLNPSTIYTLRNTRDSLEKWGYKFPDSEIFSQPINVSNELKQLLNYVHEYIERYLRKAELLLNSSNSTGFEQSIYKQRLVSSLAAIEDTLKNRAIKLNNSINQGYIEMNNENIPITPEVQQEMEKELQYIEYIELNLSKYAESKNNDPKMTSALEIVRKHRNQRNKIIVFSRFTSTTKSFIRILKDNFIYDFGLFQGDQIYYYKNQKKLESDRRTISREFKNGSFNIIVCSDAASEGLNLQSANVLINLDVPWNPARLLQRFGRIDRFGQQQENLFFYNLYYPNSIEDRMYSRLHSRNIDFRSILGNTPEITTAEHLSALQQRLLIHEEIEEFEFNNTLLSFDSKTEIHSLILNSIKLSQEWSHSDNRIFNGSLDFSFCSDPTSEKYLGLKHPFVKHLKEQLSCTMKKLTYGEVELFLLLKMDAEVFPIVEIRDLVDILFNSFKSDERLSISLDAPPDSIFDFILSNYSTVVGNPSFNFTDDENRFPKRSLIQMLDV